MTQWIEPGKKYAEGVYVFRIEKEPEFTTDSYFNKKKQTFLPMKKLVLSLLAMSDEGEFPFEERIPVWDDRYPDLLKALGIEHLIQEGANIDVAGRTFEAELKYMPDPKKPGRSWPHVVNIKVPAEETTSGGGKDDEIPF
jgi:hypothetical protein